MKHAEDLMYQIKDYLSEQGFSEPILSFSGNGYNLDYKVDLPNTKENSQLIRAVLTALSAKFSNQYVKVDTTTYNAARIIKLYGCWSCKGENTPERPYRQSKILSVPDTVSITDKGVIDRFISLNTQNPPKRKQQSASPSKPNNDDTDKKLLISGMFPSGCSLTIWATKSKRTMNIHYMLLMYVRLIKSISTAAHLCRCLITAMSFSSVITIIVQATP